MSSSSNGKLYFSSTNPDQKGCFTLEPISDLKKQTVEVSEDGARVSAWVGDLSRMISRRFEDAKTLYEGFRRGARVSNNGDCLGWREAIDGNKKIMPYRWMSYNEAIQQSEALARGFLSKGLAAGQETFVGIYSINRPEWIITEQACYVYNMVLVPLYDTLGPDACAFIVKQTEMKLIVIEQSVKAEALLAKKAECPALRTIVMIEKAEASLMEQAEAANVQIVQFADLVKDGEQLASASPAPTPPSPDDLCVISYTSGTTGNPKGAMLTHANLVADTTAICPFKYAVPDGNDTYFSFLPLAHMFERLLHAAVYALGGRIGFYRGDVKLLTDDLKELKPTVMAVVPRVLNRIYDRVMSTANKNVFKRWALSIAVMAKKWQLDGRVVRNDSMWDQYVFKNIREAMGGRVRLMFTGSAPISDDVLTFMRCALGCIILEGYGQTECVAAATITLEGDHTPGHVGVPIPCCQAKLVDVPEMGYFTKNGIGEVCFKGHTVFKGYFKDPEKTAEALDADGWLRTGDVGSWTPSGALKLVDRKKHMFKLSQGEYVTPEKLENVFSRSRFVSQIYVHGESLKSCLVAIVVPDADELPKAAENMGVRGTIVVLCGSEEVRKAVLADIVDVGKKAKLMPFEIPKGIHLHPEQFSVEAGLLTPTMKTKRPAMKEKFKSQIAAMYSSLD